MYREYLMSRVTDMAGKKFGRLTVLRRDGSDKHHQATWFCRCECGTEMIVTGCSLRRGETTSCGCARSDRARAMANTATDLTGKRFSRLMCLKKIDGPKNPNGVRWKCKCDCGAEIITFSTYLYSGKKKSCGCLFSEISSKRHGKRDMVGKTFGRLTVIEEAGRDKKSLIKWLCKCACGGETIATGALLRKGGVRSCGCLRAEISIERGAIKSAANLSATKRKKIMDNLK